MPKDPQPLTPEQEVRIFEALKERNADEIDELVGAYTHAIEMPQDTVADKDSRRAELEAIDELTEEFAEVALEERLNLSKKDQQTFEGLALTSILRQKAAQSIMETKEDVVARQATDTTEDTPIIVTPTEARTEKRQMPNMLKQAQVMKALSRLGMEVDKSGGKGSHAKVRNPETGQVTIFPQKLESGTTKKHLKQLGIDPQDFLDSF